MPLSDVCNRLGRLSRFHVVLILMVLGFLTYANAINHPFVHDDVVFIQQNPYLENLNLKDIFFQTSISDDKFPFINQYYRPFLELINRVLYRVVGLNPHGFHFFNILIHIANSFLVYNIIRFITDDKKHLSLAAAVLFLLHPVQSEAVACISGISNLIFAFLCLMSFYAYLISARTESKKRNVILYGASLILFFFALLAKEQSVVLPILIIVYEMCFTASEFQSSFVPISKIDARSAYFIKKPFKGIWKKYRRAIGFFIVLAGYFLLRRTLFGFALTPIIDSKGELWLRLLAIPRSLLTYLGLIFFPHDLHYYRSQDILLPFVLPWLLMLGVIAVTTWIVCRTSGPQRRWMIFGLSWFIISLLPVLNIVPLVNEYSKILTAEHFLYFPLIGILLFVTGAWHYRIKQKGGERTLTAGFIAVGIISIIFMGMTIKQNTYWRAEIPLFERTLQFEKDFGRVHFLLAKAYSSEGRFREAIVESRKALVIMRGYAGKVQNEKIKAFYLGFIKRIHYHIGYCLDVLGDPEGSLIEFKKALALAPGDESVWYALGINYLKIKDIDNAIIHLEKALALNVNNLRVMNSLAICYQKTGENAKAEKLLRTIVERDGQSISARQNLENLLKKKIDGALNVGY